MRPTTVAILAIAFTIPACGGDSDHDGDPDAAVGPTWYRDVAPILAERCMSCHREGGIGPFSMTSYELAAPAASMMLEAVETGLMPPWDAESSDDCTPRHGWKDDPRLTAAQTQVLRDWIATGKQEGTVATIPEPPTTELTAVTHSATPATPYVTTGVDDEFICYLLDPAVAANSWMTGIQIVPGNPKVVHHAVMVVFPPGAGLDTFRQQRGVGQPFPCGGDVVSTEGTYLMGVWTPGSQPFVTPPDLGLPVPAGSHILMQMHYHPGGAPTNLPDASTIRLRLQAERPAREYTIAAVGNAGRAPQLLPGPNDTGGTPEFRIPPNATDHVESMRFPIGDLGGNKIRLFAAYPHMHYIGVELEVQLEHPPGAEVERECLVNVPRWNFDWQRTYQYDTAIATLPTIAAGDTVTLRCSYDNSLGNPFVRRALAEKGLTEPVEVRLGEESLDEMCVGIFGVIVGP